MRNNIIPTENKQNVFYMKLRNLFVLNYYVYNVPKLNITIAHCDML